MNKVLVHVTLLGTVIVCAVISVLCWILRWGTRTKAHTVMQRTTTELATNLRLYVNGTSFSTGSGASTVTWTDTVTNSYAFYSNDAAAVATDSSTGCTYLSAGASWVALTSTASYSTIPSYPVATTPRTLIWIMNGVGCGAQFGTSGNLHNLEIGTTQIYQCHQGVNCGGSWTIALNTSETYAFVIERVNSSTWNYSYVLESTDAIGGSTSLSWPYATTTGSYAGNMMLSARPTGGKLHAHAVYDTVLDNTEIVSVAQLMFNQNVRAQLTYTESYTFYLGFSASARGYANPTLRGTLSALSVTGLPSGLTLNATTGAITGTPLGLSVSQSYTVTVNSRSSNTATVTVEVRSAPSLSYGVAELEALVGQTVTLSPTGLTDVTALTASPALPSGLTLHSATGVLSGTPTVAFSGTVTISGTPPTGTTVNNVTLTLTVRPYPTLSFAAPTELYVGGIIPTHGPTTNFTGMAFALSPALPAGLLFNTTTGQIGGTATEAAPATLYTVTVTAYGVLLSNTFTLTVFGAPTLTVPTLVEAYIGFPLDPVSAVLSYTVLGDFKLSPTDLPNGLTFNETMGTLSGTPTEEWTDNYLWDAVGPPGTTIDSAPMTLVVHAAPLVTYLFPAHLNQGLAVSLSPSLNFALQGSAPYFSCETLPAGLSLHTTTGVISGTPTDVAASTSFAIDVTGLPSGTTDSLTVTWTWSVESSPGISIPNPTVEGYIDHALVTRVALTNVAPELVVGWSVDPALPTGVTCVNGSVEGTPVAVQSTTVYTMHLSVLNGDDVTATFSLRVRAWPTLSYELYAYRFVGQSEAYLPTIGVTPDSFSISPELSNGVSLTSAGILEGVWLSQQATTEYTIVATGWPEHPSAQVSYSAIWTVYPVPVASQSDSTTTVDAPWTLPAPQWESQVAAQGWTCLGDTLPDTVTCDAETGALVGVFGTAGEWVLKLRTWVSGYGTVETGAFRVTVQPAEVPTEEYFAYDTSLIQPALWFENYSDLFVTSPRQRLVPIQNADLFSEYVAVSALPAGLTLDNRNGVIFGAPRPGTAHKTQNYHIQAKHLTTGFRIIQPVAIEVRAAQVDSLLYPPTVAIEVQTTFAIEPLVRNGAALSFSLSGEWPAGTNIDTVTGRIYGQWADDATLRDALTVQAQTFRSTVESNGVRVIPYRASQPNWSQVIDAGLIRTGDVLVAHVGVAVRMKSLIASATANFFVMPDLPSGMTLNGATGEVSGFPAYTTPVTPYRLFGLGDTQRVYSADFKLQVNETHVHDTTITNAVGGAVAGLGALALATDLWVWAKWQ